MDVTSAAETFTEGPDFFDKDKYRSTVETSLEPDPVQMEKDFQRPLSQRIIRMHSPTKPIYQKHRLDDVVVTAPSEAFRKYQQQQWNSAKKEAENKKWTSNVIAIISTSLVAITGGIMYALTQEEVKEKLGKAASYFPIALIPFLCFVGFVGMVASLIFVFKASKAINTANEQIGKWGDDPVMKIGLARNYAHDQGFPYIYQNNLKLGEGPSRTALFHPLQVEYEFKKYFNIFCNRLLRQLNPSPASWIDGFLRYNPVSDCLMNYGLGHIPEYMKPVVEDFGCFQAMLDDIANAYDRLKSKVRTTGQDQIAAYTATKNELLGPIAERRDHGIATAKKERSKVVDNPETTQKERQDAETVFDDVKKACEATYEKEASQIIQKYNRKIKDVEKECETTITKLDEQKSGQLSHNYHAARELLVRAKEAWDHKQYRPMNFDQYFPNQQIGQPVWIQQQPGYTQQSAAYSQPPPYPQQPIVHPPAAYHPQPVYPQHPAPPVVHPPAPPPVPLSGPPSRPAYGYPVHAPIPDAQHSTYTSRS